MGWDGSEYPLGCWGVLQGGQAVPSLLGPGSATEKAQLQHGKSAVGALAPTQCLAPGGPHPSRPASATTRPALPQCTWWPPPKQISITHNLTSTAPISRTRCGGMIYAPTHHSTAHSQLCTSPLALVPPAERQLHCRREHSGHNEPRYSLPPSLRPPHLLGASFMAAVNTPVTIQPW